MLNNDQKGKILESLKEHGTIVMAAKTVGCKPDAIYKEMQRYPTYRRKVQEARDHGKDSVGDSAMTVIEGIAFSNDTDSRTRLTAALSLANAFVPGFKGTSHFEGKIDHNVRIQTAVPRPTYNTQVIEGTLVKALPSPDEKRLGYNAYMRDIMRKKRATVKAQRSANATLTQPQKELVNKQ